MARGVRSKARLGAPSRSLQKRSSTPGARFGVFVAFIVAVFLLGGGARSDISSLIILRPLAAVAAAYAVMQLSAQQFGAIRFPLLFLGLCALLVAAQLIPLPPELWTSLPARDVYVDGFREAGMALPWVPLAVSPVRATNALMALLVPLAALLLFAIQSTERRASVLSVLWLIVLLSVALGIMQLAGSPSGPLYLYRITNNGLPVGLFSNRNHQALMTAVAIFLSSIMIVRELRRNPPSLPRMVGAGGALLILAPFLLIAGSRGGLIIGVALLLAGAAFAVFEWWRRGRRRPRTRVQARRETIIVSMAVATIVGVMGAMTWFSRTLALDRLMEKDVEFDLRFQVLPTLIEAASNQFPFGSGFGSFEFIYQQVEPSELLSPAYLNQAHNDWLQVILEGGLPAALLLGLFIAWFAQTSFMLLRRNRLRATGDVAAIVIIFAIGVFSLFDYPLRTPSILAVFAICCGQLAASRGES
jgi:O-antigen ligase